MTDEREFAKFDPDWTMRPGVILAAEVEASGFRAPQFAAKVTGLPPEVIGGVIDGSVEIDERIAVGLARFCGTARMWLALQDMYRAGLAAGLTDVSDQ